MENVTEIKRRIGIVKDTFKKLEKVLKNCKLPMDTKKRVLDCYVNSILLYGSECWTISTTIKKLEATEMLFYRRIMRISWTDHLTNEEVLRKAKTERSLIKTIRKRQLQFLGHIMRKERLENLMLTGYTDGKRDKGRQRQTYLGSLSRWLEERVPVRKKREVNEKELLTTSKDRMMWRTMIANVLKGYGT